MMQDQTWESQPAYDWSIDDLETEQIQKTVSESVRLDRATDPGSREPEDLLHGLGLIKDGLLLRAAVVLFGCQDRIEAEMPQCLLRVARFRGIDRTGSFLDNRQFHGNAFKLFEDGQRFLRNTLPIASRFEPDQMLRIDEPLYPPLALSEALANAVCHRDYAVVGGSIGLAIYDDRLEVTSAGPLHFDMKARNLFQPHKSRPWNPLIARAFYQRGIVEELGSGTIRMAQLTSEAGLPALEILEHDQCVTVRFSQSQVANRRPSEIDLSDLQWNILQLLRSSIQGLPLREIKTQLGQDSDLLRIREDLNILKFRGLASIRGRGRGARWHGS